MKRNRTTGSVVVLGCVLFSAAFAFLLLVLDVGRFQAARDRAETMAQTSVLGSLRMRIEGLQRIAERWNAIAPTLGAVDASGRVFVRSADISSVITAASDLSRALPGYQARTTSIISVESQSNDVLRDQIVIADNTGAHLDVQAQPAAIINESGATQTVAALWYQRGWSPADEATDPSGTVSHRVAFSLQPLLKNIDAWNAASSAQGQLRWNRSVDGNGGYPRNWDRALLDGHLNPNRTASYRAVLVEATP